MMEYFYTQLIGKSVVSEHGDHIGILRKIYADLERGHLVYFGIECQNEEIRKLFRENEEGLLLIPTERVTSIKDFIVIRVHE